MGRRPNGSASVIEVKPEDLPRICGRCRFFDYQPEYDANGNVLEPECDWESGWAWWDGFCRRHPPTTKGKLPIVSGDTPGCGDGLADKAEEPDA